jgi:hypothetical protein
MFKTRNCTGSFETRCFAIFPLTDRPARDCGDAQQSRYAQDCS